MKILELFKREKLNRINGLFLGTMFLLNAGIGMTYLPNEFSILPIILSTIGSIVILYEIFILKLERKKEKYIHQNIYQEKQKVMPHEKTNKLFETLMNERIIYNIETTTEIKNVKIINDDESSILFKYKKEDQKLVMSLFLKNHKKPFLEINLKNIIDLISTDSFFEKGKFFNSEIKMDDNYFESKEKIKVIEDAITYLEKIEENKNFIFFKSNDNKNILFPTKNEPKKSTEKTTYQEFQIEESEISILISNILETNNKFNKKQIELLNSLNNKVKDLHLLKTLKNEEYSLIDKNSNIIEDIYQNLLIIQNYDILHKLKNEKIITKLEEHLKKFNDIIDQRINNIIEKTTDDISLNSTNNLKLLQQI